MEAQGRWVSLVRRHKMELLEALMGDPDPLLQRCHARGILNNNEYNNIRDAHTRSTQARDILDCVIHKDERLALRFLKLLKMADMQETFPKLQFLHELKSNKRNTNKPTETAAKPRLETLENCVPQEPPNTFNSRPVSEREMMKAASCIGSEWKELGIMSLGLNTTALQQIEEDQRLHRERVFAMLRRWSLRERDRATPARLYTLLTQDETGLDTRRLSFLLETH